MKKVTSLVLIFVFLISLVVVQISVNAQDAAPVDPANIQTLEEAQQALADAKSKLSGVSVFQALKLIQQIKRLEARLMDLLVDGEGAKPTKCASLIDQSLAKTDASIKAITTKICDGTERVDVTFYPMEKHCKSPFDTKCVCGHHPDGPGCGGSSMSGGGHGGGMSDSGEGMSGEAMAKCIPAIEAQIAIDDLLRAREALKRLQELDANVDSVPDLCQKQN